MPHPLPDDPPGAGHEAQPGGPPGPSLSAAPSGAGPWPTAGWTSAEPPEGSLLACRLDALDEHIRATHSQIYSFLIAQHGRLLFERYYQGRGPNDPANIRSVTKSILSALVGIAVEHGYIAGLDQPLAGLLSAFPAHDPDRRKREITVRHLLTMTSGLAWNEWDDYEPWLNSDNWAAFALNLPLAAPPGAHFNYNSGAFHLLSVLIAEASGQNTRQFARRHLFAPLGIAEGDWPVDPQGHPHGSSELRLTPREMAKFGYLYQQGGRWEGAAVVPAAYVAATGREQSGGGFPEEAAYGLGWWVTSTCGYPACFAAGYGGQYIYVVPALEAVAVITANGDLAPQQVDDYVYMIDEQAMPALAAA